MLLETNILVTNIHKLNHQAFEKTTGIIFNQTKVNYMLENYSVGQDLLSINKFM